MSKQDSWRVAEESPDTLVLEYVRNQQKGFYEYQVMSGIENVLKAILCLAIVAGGLWGANYGLEQSSLSMAAFSLAVALVPLGMILLAPPRSGRNTAPVTIGGGSITASHQVPLLVALFRGLPREVKLPLNKVCDVRVRQRTIREHKVQHVVWYVEIEGELEDGSNITLSGPEAWPQFEPLSDRGRLAMEPYADAIRDRVRAAGGRLVEDVR